MDGGDERSRGFTTVSVRWTVIVIVIVIVAAVEDVVGVDILIGRRDLLFGQGEGVKRSNRQGGRLQTEFLLCNH